MWKNSVLSILFALAMSNVLISIGQGAPSPLGHRKPSQHHRGTDEKDGRMLSRSSETKLMDRFQRPRHEAATALKAAKMVLDKPTGSAVYDKPVGLLGNPSVYDAKGPSDVPNEITSGTHCQANDILDGIVSDPSDCSRYYVCVFGQEYVKACPIGLLWNHRTKSCDWPENVSCQNKNHILENMVDLRCGRDKISCSSGNQCIFLDQLCDKKPDCHDGSDEITCDPYKVGVLPGKVISVDGGTIIPFCGSGHALCTSRTQCVIISQLCDGIENCPDGSDEGEMCHDKKDI